ncbi:serine-rich protein [Moniliophthora roreri MCA 2997]|uniref:Serine-rich protein n=2 Tax=Moniliophthora roreri TaxID=221103 RepID=V2WT57_MONRO|nr:serine-rich protein [Moniliophthora roreri MCA 2997]
MAVSPITNTSSATATVIALIEYLTQPLARAQYPLATIGMLKSTLFSHFAYLLSTGTLAPFTIILSSRTLPPAPILAACMSTGINWADWIKLVADGKGNLMVFVMQGCIRVNVGDGQGEAKAIWTDDCEPVDLKVVGISKMSLSKIDQHEQSPMATKLNALLASVRSRRQLSGELQPIQVPTLPQIATSDDNEADSDSDTESTTSSARFAFSDRETASSVSSAATSPVSAKADLPCEEEEKPYLPPPAKYRPPFRAQKNQPPSPKVEHSKATVTRYMYEGGQTGVITGGVMLGASSNSSPKKTWKNTTKPTIPHRPAMSKRSNEKSKVLLGPDADSNCNWRRRSTRV